MHPLNTEFEALRSSIEPANARKKAAQKADDPVRDHLEYDDSFAEHHVSTFLYGSYKRQTAICDIKDVDLVVVTNYTTDDDPLEVLSTLKESLNELYDGTDLADQRRSIRVDRPLPDDTKSKLTLDVIPAIYQDGDSGALWVPDREKKSWVASHPQGHIDSTSQLNADSYQGQSFVRLAKMMKWWWQHQWEKRNPLSAAHARKPKGFWIEVMCGMYADLGKKSYPEQILALLENAFADFEGYRGTGYVPELPDPGLPDEVIKTSMTSSQFDRFVDILEEALENARSAVAAGTERMAGQFWRNVFGEKFPLPAGSSGSLLSAAAVPAALSFPAKPLIPMKPAGFG